MIWPLNSTKATLSRFAYHPKATLGKIVIDDLELYTAERPWRGNKKNTSCIPTGKYTCKRYDSKRFGETFELTNVPGRTYILFHVGNYPETDSQGCILLGTNIMQGRAGVAVSVKAMKKFREKLNGINEFKIIIKDQIPYDWSE